MGTAAAAAAAISPMPIIAIPPSFVALALQPRASEAVTDGGRGLRDEGLLQLLREPIVVRRIISARQRLTQPRGLSLEPVCACVQPTPRE